MLNSRSVALLGVGFGPRAVALFGVAQDQTRPTHQQNRRAIAVQGVGFGARLTALQGFGFPAGSTDGPVSRPQRLRKKKRIRRDIDDDVLLFLLR